MRYYKAILDLCQFPDIIKATIRVLDVWHVSKTVAHSHTDSLRRIGEASLLARDGVQAAEPFAFADGGLSIEVSSWFRHLFELVHYQLAVERYLELEQTHFRLQVFWIRSSLSSLRGRDPAKVKILFLDAANYCTTWSCCPGQRSLGNFTSDQPRSGWPGGW